MLTATIVTVHDLQAYHSGLIKIETLHKKRFGYTFELVGTPYNIIPLNCSVGL